MTKNRICGLFSVAVFILVVVVASTGAHAQTYTDLYNFDFTHGAYPQYPNLLAQGRNGNLYGTTAGGGTYGDGVVFRITPSGTLNVLYNFKINSIGDSPFSGLTLGTDGNFYGTTTSGGPNNWGTIFKITPNGSLTTLYNFTGSTDGHDPFAPPIQGADGNFYGVSYGGSAYRITSSGSFALLGSVPGSCSAPLLEGTDGNFYGTTLTGGRLGGGTVFKMTRKGIVTVLYNFDNTPFNKDGSSPYAPLIQATDGNFYGTTLSGGINGGGVVFKLTPRGAITVLHYFDPNNSGDGYYPYAGLVQATDGNFYGVTSYGGNVGRGVIFKITQTGSYSILYNFDGTKGGSPSATPMQHTDGKIYGLAALGTSDDGVVYSFNNAGLAPFVSLVSTSGKVGKSIGILGQGFKGTTAVSFNGTPAIFKVASSTYLTAKVPSGATTGFVIVTTPKHKLTSNKKFRVI